MSYALVHLKIKDHAIWKKTLEEAGELRKQFGSLGVRAFNLAGNPNEVFVLGEYQDLAKAKELFQSQEFRDATQKAGITAPPEVHFLEKVADLPS
jgi:uncharacterized protein (DUF1330 family)